MSFLEGMQWCLILIVIMLMIWQDYRIAKLGNRIDKMISDRNTFYQSLADPNRIVAEMEQGAVAMEALQAKRRRNIREDAGPHAKIYKPKKIGQSPFRK